MDRAEVVPLLPSSVTVTDLGARKRSATEPSDPSSRPLGLLEGAVAVAVGATSLVVDRLVDALVTALGRDAAPPAGSEEVADEPDIVETAAALVGASLHLAFGAARAVARIATGMERAMRPVSLVATVPFVDRAARSIEASAREVNESWLDDRAEAERLADAFGDALAPVMADALLDRLDLTELVVERVDVDRLADAISIDRLMERIDLNEVAAGIDVDAVAARLDVERVVQRLDLVAIANEVIDGVDLPTIIRESTETMAAETMDGVRERGMRADRFVARVVDRALLRKDDGPRHASPSTDPPTEDER